MKKLIYIVCLALSITACDQGGDVAAARPELLIYCGITMAHPITEIAEIVGKQTGAKFVISQGGSEDLYKSLAASRKGDLYLPGSASYRKRHLEEGLLGDYVHLGYNQAAMIVRTGNPKGITSDPRELVRKDIGVVIGNADTGSIGRETKRILEKAGIYQEVLDNSVFLTTDSRNLNKALREGEADVIVNWRATAFFEENRGHMEVIDMDPHLASPKKLLLNLLSFSKHPEIARRFMEYAAGPEGQAIFKKYGFIDNSVKFDE